MPASAAEVRAVARSVWDQDSQSEADITFLHAIIAADNEWSEQLGSANKMFLQGPIVSRESREAWEAVKRMATRRQLEAYRAALAALEASDFENDDMLMAAE